MKQRASTICLASAITVYATTLTPSLAHADESVIVKDIRLDGLKRIEPGTLLANLPIKRGEVFTDDKASQAVRAIYETGLFNDVIVSLDGDVVIVRVVERRLGHALAARAEEAKIGVAAGGETMIDLEAVEADLRLAFGDAQLVEAGREETRRIVQAARETVQAAGVAPGQVSALYFTGGSTGLLFLTQALAEAFPQSQAVFGDRLASVATGLGIHAQRLYG